MTVQPHAAAEVISSEGLPFRMVDLSHPISFHTPGWVGYPGMKQYYTQTLQTNRIVSQRVETSLHVGTHLGINSFSVVNMPPGVSRNIVPLAVP